MFEETKLHNFLPIKISKIDNFKVSDFLVIFHLSFSPLIDAAMSKLLSSSAVIEFGYVSEIQTDSNL